MSLDLSRRNVLTGGCAALAILALPATAEAGLLGSTSAAPRAECPHTHCRHYRGKEDGSGICALSLHAPTLAILEAHP